MRRAGPGVLRVSTLIKFPLVQAALSASLMRSCPVLELNLFEPVGVQVVFELYRWMTSSATENGQRWSEVDPLAWRRYPEILSSIGGRRGRGHTDVAPLDRRWRRDLPQRVLNALEHGGVVERWRKEQRIDPNGARRLPLLTYDSPLGVRGWGLSDKEVGEAIDALFALRSPERRLREQLNPVHPEARRVVDVELYPHAGRWIAALSYGYDGSVWREASRRGRGRDPIRAVQRGGEPFWDFIQRARRHLERALTPGCIPQRQALSARPLVSTPSHRSSACNGNWTGTRDGAEIIGGADLAEWVRAYRSSGIDDGPVLLHGEALPHEVTASEGGHTIPQRGGLFAARDRRLTPEEYLEGRVRFELQVRAFRRAYRDLNRTERERASKFFCPSGWGSALVAIAEASRYSDEVRPCPYEETYAAGVRATCEP
jgi:hypothetical protein